MKKAIFPVHWLVIPFFCFFLSCAGSQALAANDSVRIEEVTSPGGIKAWLVRDTKLPLLAMRFAFRGGVEQDPADKQGLADLTTALLTQGAGPYDAEAFQKRLADRSIQLDIDAQRDAIKGALKTLRSSRKEAFSLLQLALEKPRFDPEVIERVRGQQLAAVRRQLGSANWQARYALYSHLFAGHPYAMRSLGTPETLRRLTREDIKAFAAAHLARDNLLVAVTGDISPEELGKTLDAVFGGLPMHAHNAPVPEAAWPKDPVSVLVKRKGTQTEMLFAVPMMKRDDPDWYAAEIVNYVLGGGGFSSRLMHDVRDKAGLTYGIGTALIPMDSASLMVGQAATDNAKTGEAWDKIRDVWDSLYAKGLSEDEIEAAKDYLTGSLPLALTTRGAIADVLLDIQLDHLGRDYLDRRNGLIRKVTMADVQRVIERWFKPKPVNAVLVGEPQGVTVTNTEEQVTE